MNKNKIYYSTTSNNIVEKYPYFITNLIEKTPINSKVKIREFYIISIIKLLDCLKSGDLNATILYQKSDINLKTSFLKYKRLCLHFGFITKNGDMDRGDARKVYYSITEKGKILLDLFNHES